MALTARTRDLVDRFARELAAALAATTGSGSAEVTEVADSADAPQWLLSVAINGGTGGHVVLGLDAKGASAATRLVIASDEDPDDAAVLDTLREFGGQAIGTVSQDPVHQAIRFEVALELAAEPPPADAAIYSLSFGASVPLVVWAWGELLEQSAEQIMVPHNHPAGSDVSTPRPISGAPLNLDVILDVDLPISVRFGITEMALQALTRIGPGSVIDLARSPDDPVELLISGKVVARGEVVVVMGNYGVRITEVVSTTDRIRSMGASR